MSQPPPTYRRRASTRRGLRRRRRERYPRHPWPSPRRSRSARSPRPARQGAPRSRSRTSRTGSRSVSRQGAESRTALRARMPAPGSWLGAACPSRSLRSSECQDAYSSRDTSTAATVPYCVRNSGWWVLLTSSISAASCLLNSLTLTTNGDSPSSCLPMPFAPQAVSLVRPSRPSSRDGTAGITMRVAGSHVPTAGREASTPASPGPVVHAGRVPHRAPRSDVAYAMSCMAACNTCCAARGTAARGRGPCGASEAGFGGVRGGAGAAKRTRRAPAERPPRSRVLRRPWAGGRRPRPGGGVSPGRRRAPRRAWPWASRRRCGAWPRRPRRRGSWGCS